MKEKREERLLRLWKIRQEREGKDVSGVSTLDEAKTFYKKKKGRKAKAEGAQETETAQVQEAEAGESK